MLAVRANERSAAAAGINVFRTKLTAFAIAAFIAGIGGGLLAYQQTNVTFDQFDAILGLGLFATVYLAGVTSVSGGILAGLLASGGIVYYALSQGVNLGGWYESIAGLGLILTIIFNPEGIVGPFHKLAARRRQRRSPAPTAKPLAAAEPSTPAAANGQPRVRPEPGTTVLSVRNIGVRYGGVVAVDDVSFDVTKGSICGLIGPNGAGKTTIIDAISGFARYTGTVRLGDQTLNGLKPHRRTRAGLGRTFQGVELWDDLIVDENVSLGVNAKDDRVVEDTLGTLGLAALRDRPVGELSQGQRQLVSIARALLGNPEVLLLDEPAAGLDSTESLWLADRLRAVRDQGVTILLVDHDMGLVLGLCDDIRVLNFGRIIASGPPEAIRADPVVAKAYLGSAHTRSAGPPSDGGTSASSSFADQPSNTP